MHLKSSLKFCFIFFAALIFSPHVAHASGNTYTKNISSSVVNAATSNPTIFTYKIGTVAAWDSGKTLTVTLPGNFPAWSTLTYSVANGDGATSSTLTSGVDYSALAQVLTITETVPPAAGTFISITITAGLIPTYSGNSSIAFGGTSGETGTISLFVSAAAASPTITLGANSVVGVDGDTTLTFNAPFLIDFGFISFTMPSGIDISQVTYSSGLSGFASCSTTGVVQIVACTAGLGMSAGSNTLVLSGIKSWQVTNGTVPVTIKDGSSNTVASGNASLSTTTMGAFSSTGLAFQTNVGQQMGSVTVSITTTVTSTMAIPNNGAITIDFPSSYDISGAVGLTATNISGTTGVWTASINSVTPHKLRLSQTGGTTTPPGTISLTIGGIRNPSATGNTGSFVISTVSTQTGTVSGVAVVNVNYNQNSTSEPSVGSTGSTPTPLPLPTEVPPSVGTAPTTTPPITTTPVPPTTPELFKPFIVYKPSSDFVTQLQTGTFDVELARQVSNTVSAELGLTSSQTPINCKANTAIAIPRYPVIYYCGADGKRYVFQDTSVFLSWFPDFSWITMLTADELTSIPFGGTASFRPGQTMIKVTTDPKVYAVAPGGILRWVSSENVAARLYGADWNHHIVDVPDTLLNQYTIGASITE
ncbi:MAG: hypothetical protein NT003_02705 [Candidatus Magasanikbacteria bacterium]|nr:hypothetical protein [Candidatus Magasanikbacteria bacterium]